MPNTPGMPSYDEKPWHHPIRPSTPSAQPSHREIPQFNPERDSESSLGFSTYSLTPSGQPPRPPFLPSRVQGAVPQALPSLGNGSISESDIGQRTARILAYDDSDYEPKLDPKSPLPPDTFGTPQIVRTNQRTGAISTLLGGTFLGNGPQVMDKNPPVRRNPYFMRPGALVKEKRSVSDGNSSGGSYTGSDGGSQKGRRRKRKIKRHPEPPSQRKKFLLKLAKAFLTFGAPSHRVEAQLASASKTLSVNAAFAYLPNLILVSFTDGDTRTSELHFVRSGGRIALTALNKIHEVIREVLHDDLSCTQGIEAIDRIIKAPPLYSLIVRCLLAFVCASVICPLAFGGSFIDMWVSGTCACVLQYLGLQAAAKSAIYANVYEISVSIIVSFVARALSSIPGRIFCYSAISSAGVVLILPGFTILISALELTSRNILCGSVRLVYAIIYTFFLGFGLTIGSDFYLVVNRKAHDALEHLNNPTPEFSHGRFTDYNVTSGTFGGTFGFVNATNNLHVMKGCYRDPAFAWYRQPFPWWTMFFLVPLYSTCSSLSNLQTYRSPRLFVMVFFSCCSYAANKGANVALSDRGDIASAAGALVIGLLGNLYSRWARGTAFTSMVTGVLFLVPSGLAQAGGLTGNYDSSVQQYYSSFTLGMRMIQVAIGVTIGLFASQCIIYATGSRKNAGHMAF